MIEPREIERDRGRVVTIATLAVVAIFVFSQVAYPPAPNFSPTPDATPVDGTLKSKPHLPRLKRLNPFRKKEHEHVSPPAPEVQGPGS